MQFKKFKFPITTGLMHVGAIVITLIGIAFLVNNIILFKDVVDYYVNQGVPSNEVFKQLIPQKLLPSIFEPIAIYGGIAFILLCIGTINQKLTRCLSILDNSDNVNVDVIQQVEIQEEVNESDSDTIKEKTEENNENPLS